MADDDKANKYLEQLKLWAMGAVAVFALSIATALANRLIGVPVQLPAPPIVIVQPNPDGSVPSVHVHELKGK